MQRNSVNVENQKIYKNVLVAIGRKKKEENYWNWVPHLAKHILIKCGWQTKNLDLHLRIQ